jgi:hypothetical protein
MNDLLLQDAFFTKFTTSKGISITLDTFIGEQPLALAFCHGYNGDGPTYYKHLWSILSADGYGPMPPLPQ